MSNGAVHCRRLAGAKLLVYFKQRFLSVGGLILLKNSLVYSFVGTEYLFYLLVSTEAESSYKRSQRYLPVLVYSYINNVIGVHFILQPCSAVRDNSRFKQILTGLILIEGIINAGRTNKLRYDNTLRSVYNESTAVCHHREIAHENL